MKFLAAKIILAAGASLAVMAGVLAGPSFPTAPPLASGGQQQWVNGVPTTLAAQKGKVVVLAFWTHQCGNCKATLPYWNGWADKYGKNGDVAVLSVHTPELPAERSPEAVRAFVRERGIRFPVVTDNDSKIWNAYHVQAWPTTILIDKQGRVRGRWEGELNWQNSGEFRRVEQGIEMLRKEKP